MPHFLRLLYRLVSWSSAGLACANCLILIGNGLTGMMRLAFRGFTFVVAFVFGAIGGIVLGVERLLGRIQRFHEAQGVKALEGSWQLLYGLLSIGNTLILLVMGSGLFSR